MYRIPEMLMAFILVYSHTNAQDAPRPVNTPGAAQAPTPKDRHQVAAPMTNGDVVAMVQLGLDDELVIAKIENSEVAFDVSTSALLEMKQAKVSLAILKLMVR